LKGKGFSGRAVRVRELDPLDVEKNLTAAAKTVGANATVIELKKTEWRNGVKLMIAELSEPCEDPLAANVKWKKVDLATLEDLGSLFKVKDVLALEQIYRESYEVTQTDLDAITGKALPVAEG